MKKFNLLVLLPALLLASCAPHHYEVNDYRLTMKFHDDFKVMQLTDLHFGVESNLKEQMDFVKASILDADPDLIILTGDNFMYSTKRIVNYLYSSMNEICKELTSSHPARLTKFAVTYGNHDNQGDYYYYYLNDAVMKYATKDGNEVKDNKYAAFIDYKNDDLYGLTNYFIDLVDDRNKSKDEVDVKYRLHIFDSNTYHYLGFKYGYDVTHEEQLDHMVNIYNTATSDKDYIGLGFFHIPFMEYKDAIEQYRTSSEPSKMGQGEFLDETGGFAYKDDNAYEKMKKSNILAYFVGHNHQDYGDILYKDKDGDLSIFSNGVKSTNQLYHYEDMLGYKLITLKEGMSKEEFLSIENINANFINVTDRGGYYE